MVVAIVLIVVGLAILATGVAWALGYGPAPGTPLRESFVEAGERVHDGAAEFFEWLRLGR